MRNKLVPILSAFVVGFLGLPAWAQPLPDPTPLPNPTESPPPPITNTPAPSGSIVMGGGTANGGGVFTPILGTADPCCGQQSYWSVSGGLYLMRPYFSTNQAFTITKNPSSGVFSSRQVDFDQRVDAAPLASIGYTWASGFGIRGRWFQYEGNGKAGSDFDSTSYTFGQGPGPGVGPGTVNATSSLHLRVYDLEFTYTHGNERWSILYGAGVRYATMSQGYKADVVYTGLPETVSLLANRNFGGAGPTLSIEGRHQLWDSCFALYGSARGSILFGTASQNASYNDNSDDGSYSSSATNSSTSVLGIGEIELGAEWARTCGRFRLFAQIGVVGQIWLGGGNASQSFLLGDFGLGSTNNFGLLGGVFRAGVNF